MIGKLTGILDNVTPTEVIIDVNGVGYEVVIPLSTFDSLPLEKEKVSLYTYLYVREDLMTLYGFATKFEKDLYRVLITASGIGPKLAIKILSSVPPKSFCESLIHGDVKGLSKINGLGKKTAERLVLELKEKISDLSPESAYSTDSNEAALSQQAEEAILALVQLGFKYETAKKAVKKAASIMDKEECNSENLIRNALQGLNS